MNLTRFEQQLTRTKQHSHVEYEQQILPTGAYTLRFYNKRKQLLKERTTIDCHFLARQRELHLLGTSLEYMIRLNHTVFYKRNEYGQLSVDNICSYVDIHCNEIFVCRHFYRFGKLSPIVSYEANINNDATARLAQVSDKPLINWNKFLHDAAFNRVNRDISLKEIINKYTRTNNK